MPRKTITKKAFTANKENLVFAADCYKNFLCIFIKDLYECHSPLYFLDHSKDLASLFLKEDPKKLTVAEAWQELFSLYQFTSESESVENSIYYFTETKPQKQLKDYRDDEEIPLWECFYFLSFSTYTELISTLTDSDDTVIDLIDDYIDDYFRDCGNSFSPTIPLHKLFTLIHNSISQVYSAELLGSDDEELKHLIYMKNLAVRIFFKLFVKPFDSIYGKRGAAAISQLISSCQNSD